MPAFLHFYPGLTPESFWRLTLRERQVLSEYMQKAEAACGK